jgi:hypothetical protein
MLAGSLIAISGDLRLPCIRPFERVASPFGRQWALQRPHCSLRKEVLSFYAAFASVACACSVRPRKTRGWHKIPVPVEVASGPGSNAARSAVVQTAAETQPPYRTNWLAGSACAIGGAALLSWIVFSHSPHDANTLSHQFTDAHAEGHPTSPASTTVRTSAASKAATVDAETASQSFASTQDLAESASVAPQIDSVQSVAPEKKASPSKQGHRSSRASGLHSRAGTYSPRRPRVRQDDDYGSIDTYAGTSQNPWSGGLAPVAVNSTDWSTQVSQRRILEIPDSFGK